MKQMYRNEDLKQMSVHSSLPMLPHRERTQDTLACVPYGKEELWGRIPGCFVMSRLIGTDGP